MALRSDQRLKQADKVFLDRHTLSSVSCTQTQRQLEPGGVCLCACMVGGCGGFVCARACMHTFPYVVLNACL